MLGACSSQLTTGAKAAGDEPPPYTAGDEPPPYNDRKRVRVMLNVISARGALSQAVQTVSRGVSGRSTQPVQNNIYLESQGDALRLVATDLEHISVQAAVPVQVVGEGAVTAPARLLTEVVNSLPDAEVSLAGDASQALAVACGKSRYTIRGLSAADFQTFPPLGEGLRVSVPQGQLAEVLRQTVFAASRDETHPILTGALLSFGDGRMEVVATDTFRLARGKTATAGNHRDTESTENGEAGGTAMARTAIVSARALMQVLRALAAGNHRDTESTENGEAGGTATARAAIVSARAVRQVLRALAAGSEDVVSIAVDDTQIEFGVGHVRIGSRLIEGQYPNLDRVIPKSHDKCVTLAAEDFGAALKRVLPIAREDVNRVMLRVEGQTLELSAESQNVGKVSEEMACQLEGEPVEIAFNCRYLLEALGVLEVEEIHLELSGPLNAGVMRAKGVEDWLYVQMPMEVM